MKEFQNTLCPDEIFLQTVLWNSPFKDRIYNLNNLEKGSMRKIDWERGNPYVWQHKDFCELQNAEELFARKFNSTYPEIITFLYQTYKGS